MVSPSICGSFLSDKRSLVAFTWSITTLLTLLAFFAAIALIIQVHTHYGRMNRYYSTDDWYQQYVDDDGEEDREGGSHDEYEQYKEQQEAILMLSQMSARSISFVAAYTMILAIALSMYGSTAIVGFTSLRGVYIPPCFSSGSDKMRVGIFGGAIVVFANLLLVCAVVLGEVHVDDYRDGREMDDLEPYQVERIATVLAVACMFLSALYTMFAVLLFLCYTSDEFLSQGAVSESSTAKTPLVSVTGATDQRPLDSPGFITMDNSSEGTTA